MELTSPDQLHPSFPIEHQKVIHLSGTQESTLTSRIVSYKPLKAALDEAKRAPHTGSASTKALNDAQRARDRAWGDVKSAYNDYDKSMRKAGHEPRSLASFLTGYGTSEH